MTVKPESRRRLLWTALGVFWVGAVVTGFIMLANYDNQPGIDASAPVDWPAASRLVPSQEGPTLVLVAHPRCVCSKASLAELAELLARARHRPRTYVVFVEPKGVTSGWAYTDLWTAAERISGVTVVGDRDGVEAERFGVETSGQTLLYSSERRLLYSGGTTGARGHTGDNAGRAALLSWLDHDHARSTASVFGCPLFGHDHSNDSE